MSIRALKFLSDLGIIFGILPLVLMSFDIIIYNPWLTIASLIGFLLVSFANFITNKTPEARQNDKLIKYETIDYYKKYPLRPAVTGILVLFWLMLPYIKGHFNLRDHQIIYIALLLWYLPHMIGNMLFGGRRRVRIESSQRVSSQ